MTEHAVLSPSAASRTCEPSYTAVHFRKVRRDGSARKQTCVSCAKPASDWAYQHSSNEELTEGSLLYSVDLDSYLPMCRKCHMDLDAERNPAGAESRRAAAKAVPSDVRKRAGLASVGTLAGNQQRHDRAAAGGRAVWENNKDSKLADLARGLQVQREKIRTDPDFAEMKRSVGRKNILKANSAAAVRMRCTTCGLQSNVAGVSRHLIASKHEGKGEVL